VLRALSGSACRLLAARMASRSPESVTLDAELLAATPMRPLNGGSVTLSGDLDAILAAKSALDTDGKFARALKVDTAYTLAWMILA
jgi:hypothetical protein